VTTKSVIRDLADAQWEIPSGWERSRKLLGYFARMEMWRCSRPAGSLQGLASGLWYSSQPPTRATSARLSADVRSGVSETVCHAG